MTEHHHHIDPAGLAFPNLQPYTHTAACSPHYPIPDGYAGAMTIGGCRSEREQGFREGYAAAIGHYPGCSMIGAHMQGGWVCGACGVPQRWGIGDPPEGHPSRETRGDG